jgi:hypothetical protein
LHLSEILIEAQKTNKTIFILRSPTYFQPKHIFFTLLAENNESIFSQNYYICGDLAENKFELWRKLLAGRQK